MGFLVATSRGSSACGVWVSHCHGFSCRKAGSRACRLQQLWCVGSSSCGQGASCSHGTWNLLRPGIEPMSPALAGEFLTTGPPGNKIPLGEPPRKQRYIRGCEQRNTFGFYISSFKKLLLLSSSCLVGLGREGSWCLFNSWLIASAHISAQMYLHVKITFPQLPNQSLQEERPLLKLQDITVKNNHYWYSDAHPVACHTSHIRVCQQETTRVLF